MSFNPSQIQGGKGSNRTFYMYYQDYDIVPADNDTRLNYIKLTWPVANTKPSISSITNQGALISIIANSAPGVDIINDDIEVGILSGSNGVDNIFVAYRHGIWNGAAFVYTEYYAELNTTTSPWTFVRRLSSEDSTVSREIGQIEIVGSDVYIYTSLYSTHKIIKYNTSDYNASTEQYENAQDEVTFLAYGNTGWNYIQRPCISASSSGIYMNMNAQLNTATDRGWHHRIYDTNLNLIKDINLEVEGYLGWHCDWEKAGSNVRYADTRSYQTFCGEYPNYAFTISDSNFLIEETYPFGVLELNPTTLRPTRFSTFLSYPNINIPFEDDDDIYDAVTLEETYYGTVEPVNDAVNCTPMAVGVDGDDLVTATRYNYRGDSVLTIDYPSHLYIRMSPESPTDVDDDLIYGSGIHCPSTVYRLEKRTWGALDTDVTINTAYNLAFIKPSTWTHNYPWFVRSLCYTTNYIFVALACQSITMRPLFYLLKLSRASGELLDEIDFSDYDTLVDAGLTSYNLGYITGNDSLIYMWWYSSSAKILTINTNTMAINNPALTKGSEANPIPGGSSSLYGSLVRGFAGPCADGYLYTIERATVNSEHHTVIFRRDSDDYYISTSEPVNWMDLNTEYYDTAEWALNPHDNTQTPFFGFGGDSDRIVAAGLDVVGATTNMYLYEFNTASLELDRSTSYCVNYTPPVSIIEGHVISYL